MENSNGASNHNGQQASGGIARRTWDWVRGNKKNGPNSKSVDHEPTIREQTRRYPLKNIAY